MKSCFGDQRIPKWMSEAFSSNFASIVFEVYAFDLWHCFKIWVIMSGYKFINYLRWTNTFLPLASFACGISNIMYNFYYTSINIYFTTIVIVYKLVISISSLRQGSCISWISIISNRIRSVGSGGGVHSMLLQTIMWLGVVKRCTDATAIRPFVHKACEMNWKRWVALNFRRCVWRCGKLWSFWWQKAFMDWKKLFSRSDTRFFTFFLRWKLASLNNDKQNTLET